jgi:plastocyanin
MAADTHEIQVTASEFTPKELTIKPGDTVRWVWVAGAHQILDGEPSGDTVGEIFKFPISSAAPEHERVFDKAGVFPYFAEGTAEMTGVITVQESTPVEVKTWGWLKAVFEGGASSSLRNRN